MSTASGTGTGPTTGRHHSVSVTFAETTSTRWSTVDNPAPRSRNNGLPVRRSSAGRPVVGLQIDNGHPRAQQRVVTVIEVITDTKAVDPTTDAPPDLITGQEFAEHLPQRVGVRAWSQQRRLGLGVAQDRRRHGTSFQLIGVQQGLRYSSTHHRPEFPPQVDSVLNPQVEPLTARREVDMSGVARE